LKQKTNVFYYIVLSIAAAVLLLIVAFFSNSNIIGGVFITSCLFGTSLTIYPGWFKRFTKQEKHNPNNMMTQKTARKRKGHHPKCEQFQNHTMRIGNKTLCAGCLGLSVGSILSIFLMILYIVIGGKLSFTTFYFFIFLGLTIIGLVYVELMLSIRHAFLHVLSNIFLIVSFFIVTISIFEITGSKIYGTISVILSFLWLDTRIRLSNWNHTQICENCSETCKMY